MVFEYEYILDTLLDLTCCDYWLFADFGIHSDLREHILVSY